MRLEILTPSGMPREDLVLEAEWGRADRAGITTEPHLVRLAHCREEDESLVFDLDLGALPHGVYTIACRLQAGGEVLETREREPIMVQRKLEQKTVKGKTYTQGLDLVREDHIDFTDARDPHPWVETTPSKTVTRPRVVKQAGLLYRETAAQRMASFQYRFTFDHPGAWYLLELRYPDNAERVVEASVTSKKRRVASNSQSGVGAETGGRLYTSGDMRTLSWVHVADAGVHSIDIVNGRDGTRAAAASFTVSRIRGDLPAVEAGHQRHFGIHTERCSFQSGIGRNFGVSRPRDSRREPLMLRFIRDQVFLEAAADRYVQYLHFAGQNTHIMGCFQYNDRNSPYIPVRDWNTARLPQCPKSVVAAMFELNAIDFYAGLEVTQFKNIVTRWNDRQVARGADTVWMIDGKGRQKAGTDIITVQNWLHPRYRAAYRRVLEQLGEKFNRYEHYRGIHAIHGPAQWAGYYPPALADARVGYDQPYRYSYDDASFGRFEDVSGLDLQISGTDPDRFEKRAHAVKAPEVLPAFRTWRCRAFREYVNEAVACITKDRPDLDYMAALAIEDPDFFRAFSEQDRPYSDFLKDYALDLDSFDAMPHVWLGRWTVGWRHAGARQDPLLWLPMRDSLVIQAYDRPAHRYVFVRTSWDENITLGPGMGRYKRGMLSDIIDADWVLNVNKVRVLPQAAGRLSREGLACGLITGDPQALMHGFTDLNINVGREQEQREFSTVYTRLPGASFSPLLDTDLTTELAVRRLSRDGHTWIYVVNPGYWPVRGHLTLTARPSGTGRTMTVRDLASDSPVRIPARTGQLPLDLPPYGLAAFVMNTGEVTVTDYETDGVDGRYLAPLYRLIRLVTETYPVVRSYVGLDGDEEAFLQATAEAAARDVEQGRPIRAWDRLLQPRFMSLVEDRIESVNRFRRGNLACVTGDRMARVAVYWQGQPIISRKSICMTGRSRDGRTGYHTDTTYHGGAPEVFSEDAGTLTFGYKGPGFHAAYHYADTAQLTATSVVWNVRCAPAHELHRRPPHDFWLRLWYLSSSPLLWGIPVTVTDAQGSLFTVDIPEWDDRAAERWGRSFHNVERLDFQTRLGRFRMHIDTRDQEPGMPGGLDVVVLRRLLDEGSVSHGWRFHWKATVPGDHPIPAGREHAVTVTMTFTPVNP